ncbi:hypothetical protein A3X42_23540, partial [Salmonella enterica subsp. enterica serovar Kentucky]|nr:hypothetical protein [Salmonella enterica subsp. enterica serovar Kentucky]
LDDKTICYTARQLCNNSLYKSIFVHMFVRTADCLDEGQTPFRAYGPACSNATKQKHHAWIASARSVKF